MDEIKLKISQDVGPLFSDDEIKSQVKGFILAFQQNKIRIVFDEERRVEKNPELYALFKTSEFDIGGLHSAQEKRIKLSEEITKMISNCVHPPDPSPEQEYYSVGELFDTITLLRGMGILEGEFMDYKSIEKINSLEKEISELKKSVNHLIRKFDDLGT